MTAAADDCGRPACGCSVLIGSQREHVDMGDITVELSGHEAGGHRAANITIIINIKRALIFEFMFGRWSP